ncbi:hypothetical protein K505DRAFT_329923 [Melanomma pulvis-pyrius CBS 109.77]|uniref:Uncharacterized protein n=1 Tax=Melanomma pulvis-pyrius CBS 109.77 TaxID=1314802 RepID=A0A6A6WSF5_9PLEO|nr:hypothetical protein K505DRAFT_329923 [Melanomma pulvis-pyrius CBS 109.77]
MIGQALTFNALVALAQAKAIVSNQCAHDVYLWSVPDAQGYASALPIGSGKQYNEPWRLGTSVSPGIAIKVSPYPNGINEGKSEIDFQYTLDHEKVWIDLSNIRGNKFNGNITFFTCGGTYKTPNSPTRQCRVTDDVELVLCGTERTSPAQDTTSLDVIDKCSSPGVQRDDKKTSRRLRQCNARVVGPKRTTQPMMQTGANKPKKETQTVPLKTLLQSDCSWAHSTDGCPHNQTTPTTRNQPNTDLDMCELFPEFPWCGEEDARETVKAIYSLCDQAEMLGLDAANVSICIALNRELKRVYPGVDKPIQALRRSRSKQEKIYIGRMCKKFIPNTKCSKVENFLDERNPWYSFTDSTTDDDENYGMNAANTTANFDPKTPIPIGGMCREFMPEVGCSKVEEFLEERNTGFDFTVADKIAVDRKPATTEKKALGRKPAAIQAQKSQKPVMCVNNFCHRNRQTSCHSIKKAFKVVDGKYDYTTDSDKGCSTDKD